MLTKLVLLPMRRAAYYSVILPAGLILLLMPFISFLGYHRLAYAFGLGGLMWFLPNLYSAFRLFHHIETDAKRFLTIFYRTELQKLALVATVFIIVIKVIDLNPAGLLVGYVSAQVFFWLLLSYIRSY